MSCFAEAEWDAMQDGIYEERNQRAADRGCPHCVSGCEDCWDTYEQEETEDE